MRKMGHGSAEHHDIGTARQLDQLGRIVVPAELRRMVGLRTGDLLDFRIIAGHITIIKVDPECALCGNREGLVAHLDKSICAECIQDVGEIGLGQLRT
jgi:AbrB family transcriptional regulator, transcriptional pleiotropic regulator of transition state genes